MDLEKSHGRSAMDYSLMSLSIEQQSCKEVKNHTNEDPRNLNHEDLGMNEELFMEFMLEQELTRHCEEDNNFKNNFSIGNLKKNTESKVVDTVLHSLPLHNSRSRVLSKDKQVKKSNRILSEQSKKSLNLKNI